MPFLSLTLVVEAAVGGMLTDNSQTVHVGARMALLRGVMKRERDGAIISTCEHNKFTTGADGAKL